MLKRPGVENVSRKCKFAMWMKREREREIELSCQLRLFWQISHRCRRRPADRERIHCRGGAAAAISAAAVLQRMKTPLERARHCSRITTAAQGTVRAREECKSSDAVKSLASTTPITHRNNTARLYFYCSIPNFLTSTTHHHFESMCAMIWKAFL